MPSVSANFGPTDPNVSEYAACRNTDDPELFFRQGKEEQAKAICHQCPVKRECLAEALSCGTRLAGVWGETTQRQRFRMLRRRVA